MKQIIIKTLNGALALATSMIKGVNKYGVIAKIKQNTEEAITADRAAVVAAADTLDVGRQLLRGLRATFFDAREQVRRFIMATRDILKPIFGSEYNENWDVTGFVGSIAVPKAQEDLEQLAEKLKLFFAANPTLEVAVRQITSVQAATLFTAMSNARTAVEDQEAVVQQLMIGRDKAFDTLQIRMRGLIGELTQLLDPMDPLWLAFGLNRPGAIETPDVVENVMVTLIGATTAAAKWTAPPRAEHYRVWMRVVGVDADFVAIASPTDPDVTLESLPANKTIEIAVSAVNNGGEGARSEVITIVTH
ncbi:MAG: hypothetical protein JWM68_2569 [Verrucomicrobiales bacterium]|nr:hypothetical protein [Verrucomicrobiales bacterium]